MQYERNMGLGPLFPLAIYIPSYSGGRLMGAKATLIGWHYMGKQIEAVIVDAVSCLELYSLVESKLGILPSTPGGGLSIALLSLNDE